MDKGLKPLAYPANEGAARRLPFSNEGEGVFEG